MTPSFDYEVRGDLADTALRPGGVMPAWEATDLAGEPVRVPDPAGGYVVLELIRSADW